MYSALLLFLFFPLSKTPLQLVRRRLRALRLSQTILAFVCCVLSTTVCVTPLRSLSTHTHTHTHARCLTHTPTAGQRDKQRHAHIDTRSATHAITTPRRAARLQFNNFELELELELKFDCLSLLLTVPLLLSLLRTALSRWHFRNNATCLAAAAADSLRRSLPLFYLIFAFFFLWLFMSLVGFAFVCVCLLLSKAFRLKCR